MTLKQYLVQIAEIYKTAAPEYIEVLKAERQAREDIVRIKGSADLTPQGKRKKIEELEQDCAKCKKIMESIASEAREKALGVRREVEQHFYSRFHVSPADLDMNAVELLKSGILTDAELENLAAQYNGNATMQRMIGKYMQERTNSDLQKLGRVLQHSNTNVHLNYVDSIIDAGNYMLGGAPLSGPSASEAFYNRFYELIADTLTNAPNIE